VLDRDAADRLRDALAAERDALDGVEQAKDMIRDALVSALKSGASYDDIAKVTLRCRLDRAPKIDERLREIERLKKRRRRRGKTCPPVSVGSGSQLSAPSVGSPSKENTMSRLIKRTVTEEYVRDDGKDDEKVCADDEPAAAAEDEGEDEEDEEDEDDDEDE
jgi:hypothetical protein